MSRYLVAKVKSSEILDWENVNLSCIELDCNSSVLITRLKNMLYSVSLQSVGEKGLILT